MDNIHASCVEFKGKGILLLGKSGSGKSDITLRLIENLGANLVADDRTNITLKNNQIIASCPSNILGLLEVRGIGLVKFQSKPETKIDVVINLVDNFSQIERIPQKKYWEYQGVKIKSVDIYPFEESAIYKIKLACDENL